MSFCNLISAIAILGCTTACGISMPKFTTETCAMSKASNSPQSVIKIVGIVDGKYRVFTHFLFQGKLILAEDYNLKDQKQVEENYLVVACPNPDSTFSPDKYLNKIDSK